MNREIFAPDPRLLRAHFRSKLQAEFGRARSVSENKKSAFPDVRGGNRVRNRPPNQSEAVWLNRAGSMIRATSLAMSRWAVGFQ